MLGMQSVFIVMSYGVHGLNDVSVAPNHYNFFVMVNWYQWIRLQFMYPQTAQSTDNVFYTSLERTHLALL